MAGRGVAPPDEQGPAGEYHHACNPVDADGIGRCRRFALSSPPTPTPHVPLLCSPLIVTPFDRPAGSTRDQS